MPILDEIDFGTKCTFHEYVEDWKRDASRQESLVTIVAQILDQESRKNDLQHNSGYPTRVTVFHSSRPPNVSTRQYVERIAAFSGCSPCCLIIALKYLQDLSKQDPAFLLDSLNGHRLILTAVMVAAKFLDDFYYSNGYWAKVGGISTAELNGLEMEFLFLKKFSLHMKRSEYDEFLVSMLKLSNEFEAQEIEIARQMQMLAMRRNAEISSPADTMKSTAAMIPVGVAQSSSFRRLPDGKIELHQGAVLAHPPMGYAYTVRPNLAERKTGPANIPC